MSKLRTVATEWHSVEYTNSNNRLYSIFAELYTLYETCIDIKAEANVRKHKWLKAASLNPVCNLSVNTAR